MLVGVQGIKNSSRAWIIAGEGRKNNRATMEPEQKVI